MRQANSVKIAKIIAITVVLSSFILGSFILASSYLQAKQSCDQMQALDAVLNKELMLEAMQQLGRNPLVTPFKHFRIIRGDMALRCRCAIVS
uniref:Uncharacterized protein n=1 Tax=Anopheles albimanus TaxID=7167 RepID=A0A182FD37_ANOAL